MVVRVHPEVLAAGRIPAAERKRLWTRRYREINDWEHYLVDNGVHVVKIILNLSKQEQAKHFSTASTTQEELEVLTKRFKERVYWDEYQSAFNPMLSNTITQWAPWHVVPADHKWFARLATATVLVTALRAINPRYPAADPAQRASDGTGPGRNLRQNSRHKDNLPPNGQWRVLPPRLRWRCRGWRLDAVPGVGT